VVVETPLPDQLQYEALSKPQNIRLLHRTPGEEILCSLVEVDWVTNPSYEALSYTWGSLEVGKSIICNGRHVSVSVNLFHALRQIRRPDTEVIFWIDQPCIYSDRSRIKHLQNLRLLIPQLKELRRDPSEHAINMSKHLSTQLLFCSIAQSHLTSEVRILLLMFSKGQTVRYSTLVIQRNLSYSLSVFVVR
jgi:hypothetical protein